MPRAYETAPAANSPPRDREDQIGLEPRVEHLLRELAARGAERVPGENLTDV